MTAFTHAPEYTYNSACTAHLTQVDRLVLVDGLETLEHLVVESLARFLGRRVATALGRGLGHAAAQVARASRFFCVGSPGVTRRRPRPLVGSVRSLLNRSVKSH